MDREEQIRTAALKHCGDTYMKEIAYAMFCFGARWTDEHPKEGLVSIDKACEYLESAIRPYMGYSATCDFVDAFRKVMEK